MAVDLYLIHRRNPRIPSRDVVRGSRAPRASVSKRRPAPTLHGFNQAVPAWSSPLTLPASCQPPPISWPQFLPVSSPSMRQSAHNQSIPPNEPNCRLDPSVLELTVPPLYRFIPKLIIFETQEYFVLGTSLALHWLSRLLGSDVHDIKVIVPASTVAKATTAAVLQTEPVVFSLLFKLTIWPRYGTHSNRLWLSDRLYERKQSLVLKTRPISFPLSERLNAVDTDLWKAESCLQDGTYHISALGAVYFQYNFFVPYCWRSSGTRALIVLDLCGLATLPSLELCSHPIRRSISTTNLVFVLVLTPSHRGDADSAAVVYPRPTLGFSLSFGLRLEFEPEFNYGTPIQLQPVLHPSGSGLNSGVYVPQPDPETTHTPSVFKPLHQLCDGRRYRRTPKLIAQQNSSERLSVMQGIVILGANQCRSPEHNSAQDTNYGSFRSRGK
ncbi:hypothetical protein DFH09DRAFT_1275979 [Mycena vulgaris]|nr:hypothetical protein DFH09DRAFT_1275979 [Mycena vulgaris]